MKDLVDKSKNKIFIKQVLPNSSLFNFAFQFFFSNLLYSSIEGFLVVLYCISKTVDSTAVCKSIPPELTATESARSVQQKSTQECSDVRHTLFSV